MDDARVPAGSGAPIEPPTRAGEMKPPFVPLRLLPEEGPPLVLSRPEMLLGRHSQSDVCLRLPDVSRKHCRFVYAAGWWRVFDLQSLNGLFVNDERVHEATLRHRDRIRIGRYIFEVDLNACDGSAIRTERISLPPERLAS